MFIKFLSCYFETIHNLRLNLLTFVCMSSLILTAIVPSNLNAQESQLSASDKTDVNVASYPSAQTTSSSNSIIQFSLSDIPEEGQINREPWDSYNHILLLEQSGQFEDKKSKIQLLIQKAHAENLLYFFQKFSETAQKIAMLIDDKSSIVHSSTSLFYIGVRLQREGLYAESIKALREAISQTRDTDLNRIFVMAKLELAYTQSLTELFETSLVELQEAYLKAYTMDDKFLLAFINETYGAIYGFMSEYEKSVEYHQKAIDGFTHLKFKAHIADATYGLASTFRYWGKYDLAIQNYQYYGEIISYTPNTDVGFYGAYGLSMSYAEKKSCDKALEQIEVALALNGMPDYNAELYKRKASCLIDEGRLQEADIAIGEAERIFDGLPEISGTQWDLETKKVRAFLAYAKGDSENGFMLINDYYQSYVDLLLKNSSERLVRVRAAMDLERQNIEYVLLEQRSKVQSLLVEQQLQKNIQQSYLIFAAAVIIAVIALLLVIQQRNNLKVVALSIRDPLSGLFNRRYVFDYIDQLLANSSPDKMALSLVMLDIDDFKDLNDKYGHPFGDKVILGIANIGKEILRTEDVMGRIGGEEFLCVLPRLSENHCEVIAERIKNRVIEYPFETENGIRVTVSVSIGVTRVTPVSFDRDTLYAQADQAMYYSKRKGKNRVTYFADINQASEI